MCSPDASLTTRDKLVLVAGAVVFLGAFVLLHKYTNLLNNDDDYERSR